MSWTTGMNAAAGMQEAVKADNKTEKTDDRSNVTGKTIGDPKLSDKAAKYYEELKKKYNNMEFILVSKDQKENAKAQAGRYANASRMVVLIDEEKIERMAVDAEFRKQYEGIIKNGANQLSQMANELKNSGVKVNSFGMEIKDGRASFFATIDKSLNDQRARQAERIEAKRAAKKAASRKADKDRRKEQLENKRTEKQADAKKDADKRADGKKAGEDAPVREQEVISASSVEELIKRVQDYQFSYMSDSVQTEGEKMVGQHVNYSA